MIFACILSSTAKRGSNNIERSKILARTIGVPGEVQTVVREIQFRGLHLEPPFALYGSEVREAVRALRGDGDEVRPEMPSRLKDLKHVHAPTVLGRWTASVFHAAIQRVMRSDGSHTGINLIFPFKDSPRYRLSRVGETVEIQDY